MNTTPVPGSPEDSQGQVPPAPPHQPPGEGYPGQQHPGPAGPPPQGAAIMLGIQELLTVLKLLWRSQIVEALQLAVRSKAFWMVTLLGGAVVAGVTFSIAMGRIAGTLMSTVSSMLGGGSVYFGLSFGIWFGTLAITIIMVLITLGLRAVALHATFRIAGKPQPMSTSLATVTTAYSMYLPILAVVFLLILIPGYTWMMLVLLLGAFLGTVAGLAAELILYIGINRAADFERSPLRTYVMMTGVWYIVMMIVFFIVSLITSESTLR